MDVLRRARLACRDLGRQPGYAVAAIVTLALAIGANSAIFSAVYAVILKPSAIRHPENLVMCWGRQRTGAAVVEVSYRNFQDWAAHSRSFTQAAAVGSSTWPVILDVQGERLRLSSAAVSGTFFETVGVTPALGRAFRTDDDRPMLCGWSS